MMIILNNILFYDDYKPYNINHLLYN